MAAAAEAKAEPSAAPAERRIAACNARGFVMVNDDLFCAGALSEEDLRSIAAEGVFKTVMNLRDSSEGDFLAEEEAICAEVGLGYAHIPIWPSTLTDDTMDTVLKAIDEAEKPICIHCKSAVRASAAALLHSTLRSPMTGAIPNEAQDRATKAEWLKNFSKKYVDGRLADVVGCQLHIVKPAQLYAGPQPTEAQFRALASAENGVVPGGIKSVLNLRDMEAEKHHIGFAVVTGEKELVEGLGITYVNIPTDIDPKPDQVEAIAKALETLPQPTYMHCRTMLRTEIVFGELGIKEEGGH